MSQDLMTRAHFDELLEADEQGIAFSQAENAIEMNGQRFVPDDTKGFLAFKMSHAFPVVTAYGQGLMPKVIEQSYNSLLYQNFNREHRLVSYDTAHQSDSIIGTIICVDFPRGQHRISKNKAESPSIRGVASFSKLATGMQTLIGRHQSGRHKYSVSMEIQYRFSECGFAVALNDGEKPAHETPPDLVEAGWEYIPWTDADEELLNTFSRKKNRIIGDWRKRKVVMLLGGANGRVHYSGLAVVQFPAEKQAEILQLAASIRESEEERESREVLAPLFRLAALAKC